ncbi:hypothetical protein B0H16DRAFT_1617099 [Mycena metata]|uniref:F-box domain-containing protein n=1 Tax=Mycena metata TaxID=1033252 RepID=A0AAD7H979_9AGAR|nr:hypothetical protein B0H16DRAFT_1617099 [Mycena metata]
MGSSTSPGSLELPPELTDLIVSKVEGDTALRACSLVSRAWCASSRHRLYQRLRLRRLEDVSNFLDLIASPDNTYVHALSAIELEEGGDCSERMCVLLARLTDFLRLKSIEIQMRTFPCLTSTPPNVTSLALRATTFSSFTEFAALVLRFPKLKTLHLRGIQWTDKSSPIVSLTTPELEELKFDGTFLKHQCSRDWLGADSTSPGLVVRRLILVLEPSGMDSVVAGGLSKFLRRLGPHLTSFAIHITTRDLSSSFVENIDFSTNTGLQSLRIDGAIELYAVDDEGFFEFFLDISRQLVSLLGRIQTPCVGQLVIGVRIKWYSSELTIEDRDPAPLEHLVRILDHPAYSALEEIRFTAAWDHSWGLRVYKYDRETFDEIMGYHPREFTHLVLKKLPRWDERAVLLVHEECSDCE